MWLIFRISIESFVIVELKLEEFLLFAMHKGEALDNVHSGRA